MGWYSWESEEKFNVWHNVVCLSMGIPYPNSNLATGEIDLSATWTTAYTSLVKVSPNDYRAFVDEDVAINNPNSLGILCDESPQDLLPPETEI